MRYDKLVRDRIPEIIDENGLEAITRILDPTEYKRALKEKLGEETDEFLAHDEPGELADILEVVYALAATAGIDQGRLEAMRRQKHRDRGGFQSRIFLIETRPVDDQ
ncbi:MAG: phosphoribosyl-ATP pyrophosphohydrolase [Candidatus Latescibacteria bacterium]|nr:phosphoribosyl-ATP pyrophosphohydrolase [Candidatus Latescibacterota bacterium]